MAMVFLYVPPSGVSAWQFRYKLAGKHQTLTLGKASAMTLAEARRRTDQARTDAADGKYLTTLKRVFRAKVAAEHSDTFATIADAWIRKRRPTPWSERHRAQVRASIANHLEA
jgi:hypothetical protein